MSKLPLNPYGWADVLVRALGTDDTWPSTMLVHVYDGWAYTTDSYRAARDVVSMPDGAYGLDGQPVSDESGLGRTSANLFKDALDESQTIVLADGSWHSTSKAVADSLDFWSYYDGTRRKPASWVNLDVIDGKLCLTFGVEVAEGSARHNLRSDRAAVSCPVDGYAIGHKSQFLGRFNVRYLNDAWVHGGAPTLCWKGDLKPLAISHPSDAQTLVMPIRT